MLKGTQMQTRNTFEPKKLRKEEMKHHRKNIYIMQVDEQTHIKTQDF